VDLTVAAINAAVVVMVSSIAGWLFKGRLDALEQQMNERFAEMGRRMDRLEERVDRGFDSIRSDLTRVALAVGVRPEAEAGGA
jgi:hypothetical protein